MDYVYIVTITSRGAKKGEFFGTPTAFEDLIDARASVHVCQQTLGERFTEVSSVESEIHIVQRWDSEYFSVWLERLIFKAAQ